MAETRRAMMSVDVNVDETTGRASFDLNLEAMTATLAAIAAGAGMATPTVWEPQADASLDDDLWHELAIPADALALRFCVDQSAYINLGPAGTDPSEDGVEYFPKIVYPMPAVGMAKLYGKRASATAVLKWSVLTTAS